MFKPGDRVVPTDDAISRGCNSRWIGYVVAPNPMPLTQASPARQEISDALDELEHVGKLVRVIWDGRPGKRYIVAEDLRLVPMRDNKRRKVLAKSVKHRPIR
jgi:hypothetical protein